MTQKQDATRPRNGLEPPPRSAQLVRWICDGMRNGRPCHNVLMEGRFPSGTHIRKRCHKCGTWHTKTVE